MTAVQQQQQQPRPVGAKERANWTHYEVEFPARGDLGVGIKVDKDGVVVVNEMKQIKGYAELQCPELKSGDLLVAVDHQPVCGKPFSQVMRLLHDSKQTRPTHLEFLSVDYYEAREGAVGKWMTRQDTSGFVHEGEFDVDFDPQQPTGIRFAESYLMTNPLKLAHIEDAIFDAVQSTDRAVMRKLVHMVLVRVDSHSVLGAPVNEVTALMHDVETSSFPKDLWLASADDLQEDYTVLTIKHAEQLKWLCFVPIEMMMEVPSVSFAAKAASAAVVKSSDGTYQSERRDGVRAEQYLMAINGIPTLRISAASFSDEKSSKEVSSSLLDVVTKSLDSLLGCKRTLRFRDLKEYRREFQMHQPLSPWNRRRRQPESMVAIDSESDGLVSMLNDLSLDDSKSDNIQDGDRAAIADDQRIKITRRPRNFFRLLMEELGGQLPAQDVPVAADTKISQSGDPSKRPHIKTYCGLENCEGRRLATHAHPGNVRKIVIPDNLRPVGVRLETELMTTYTIFKSFTRMDGPVLSSKRVSKGDIVVSIDGVPVEDIPTDKLIRLLQGQAESDQEEQQSAIPINVKQFQASKREGVESDSASIQQEVRTIRFARKNGRRVTSLLSGLWRSASKEETLGEVGEEPRRVSDVS